LQRNNAGSETARRTAKLEQPKERAADQCL
jgi:hypothetical protein